MGLSAGSKMGPIGALKSGFAKYADFNGRASRSEFWWWAIIIVSGKFILSFNDYVYVIYCLIVFIPTISVNVRRFHDIDKTGSFVFLSIIPTFTKTSFNPDFEFIVEQLKSSPLIGFCMFIFTVSVVAVLLGVVILLCRPGTPGPNRFGEDPKAQSVLSDGHAH